MRKLDNGATVICDVPLPNGWRVVLCDWDGESVSWMEGPDGSTIQGCYRGDAIPAFLRRAGLDSLNGWYNGEVR